MNAAWAAALILSGLALWGAVGAVLAWTLGRVVQLREDGERVRQAKAGQR